MTETQHNLSQFEAQSLTGRTNCDILKTSWSRKVSISSRSQNWKSRLGLGENLERSRLCLKRKGLVYIPDWWKRMHYHWHIT